MVTRVGGRKVYDTFLEEDKSLCRLESGARRVCRHKCAVKERFVLVLYEFAVVFAALSPYEECRVVSR